MGKHKISITNFVDVAKSQSEEDLFGGLEEGYGEPEKESYVEPPKQQAVAGWNLQRSRSRSPARVPIFDVQTREDVSEFVESTVKDSGYYPDQEESKYDGIREEGGLYGDDDDSATLSHDESTLMSADTRSTIEEPGPKMALCSDDVSLQKIVELSRQTGASLDDLNKFLAEELEVDGLAQDMSALRQEVVKNGLDSLHQIDLATLFSQFTASNSQEQDKPLQLNTTPEDAKFNEDEKEDSSTKQTTEPPRTSSLVACLTMEMDDVAAEEGMEIPYFTCEGVLNKPASKDKKNPAAPALLSRLLLGGSQNKIKDNPEYSEDKINDSPQSFETLLVATVADSPPFAFLDIMRVQLDDGDMASVSKDTVAKLQNCEWV